MPRAATRHSYSVWIRTASAATVLSLSVAGARAWNVRFTRPSQSLKPLEWRSSAGRLQRRMNKLNLVIFSPNLLSTLETRQLDGRPHIMSAFGAGIFFVICCVLCPSVFFIFLRFLFSIYEFCVTVLPTSSLVLGSQVMLNACRERERERERERSLFAI